MVFRPATMFRLHFFFIVLAAFVCQSTLQAEDARPVYRHLCLYAPASSFNRHMSVTYRVAEWAQQARALDPSRLRLLRHRLRQRPDLVYRRRRRHYPQQAPLTGSRSSTFSQEAGPESTNKRSLWIWPVFDVPLRPRLTGRVRSPTPPFRSTARRKQVLLRRPRQNRVGRHIPLGKPVRAMQAAPIQVPGKTAHSSPPPAQRRSASLSSGCNGPREGAQIQLRYMLVRSEH